MSSLPLEILALLRFIQGDYRYKELASLVPYVLGEVAPVAGGFHAPIEIHGIPYDLYIMPSHPTIEMMANIWEQEMKGGGDGICA